MLEFFKYHGLGNDFILIENLEKTLGSGYGRLAEFLCGRGLSVGADGMVVLEPAGSGFTAGKYRMRIFNPDGSEAEMCGNAIRCVGLHLKRRKMIKRSLSELTLETGAGPRTVYFPDKGGGDVIRVHMGAPSWSSDSIPVTSVQSQILEKSLMVVDRYFSINCVSFGNPHCVIVVDGKLEDFPVDTWGPAIENHPFFPERTNVEFIQPVGDQMLKMRVWERGAKETMACGTGACAAAVISARLGFTDRRVSVLLPAGRLDVEWERGTGVYLTGPAEFVYTGRLPDSGCKFLKGELNNAESRAS